MPRRLSTAAVTTPGPVSDPDRGDVISDAGLVALVGLFGGALLGLAARIGRFCTLGAIEDLYYGENTLRLRMWGMAIGVSVIGTFGLSLMGLLDLSQTL